jgi:glycerol-3-phosphate dehydrogenase
MDPSQPLDLFVVGGGINGAGIACDAAGRTLKVGLCDMQDFAAATSSASSKLIHGGLRYLEQYEFRLVREALMEREVLLHKAPHISWPLRFVLPHEPHLRPKWMLRAGLFLYDHLDLRMTLPKSRAVRLRESPFGEGLAPQFRDGFVYSDAWVDDARLVICNLKSARDMGVQIWPRHRCVTARRDGELWRIELEPVGGGAHVLVSARGLVNASGPWVGSWLRDVAAQPTAKRIRLVKGSHIVVPRLHGGEHAFILQNRDNRIVFVIPYQRNFSLIGTTDVPFEGDPRAVAISTEEETYLCEIANAYLARRIGRQDIVWSYAGVRPLFDDGSDDPSAVTRDYVLETTDTEGKLPLLSVFGGKITTYRRLAEHALDDLRPYYPRMGPVWTAGAALADGELVEAATPALAFEAFVAGLVRQYPALPADYLTVLARRHGTGCDGILEDSEGVGDLGHHFGGHLYEREVEYLMREEWARTADDILWRRTKEGLHLHAEQRAALADWIAGRRANAA